LQSENIPGNISATDVSVADILPGKYFSVKGGGNISTIFPCQRIYKCELMFYNSSNK
jgi:hypothetical protein